MAIGTCIVGARETFVDLKIHNALLLIVDAIKRHFVGLGVVDQVRRARILLSVNCD